MEEKKKTNKKFIIIIAALVTIGVVYGGYKFIHSLSHEETDDAQISANMNPIIPHVGGYIQEVFEPSLEISAFASNCCLV